MSDGDEKGSWWGSWVKSAKDKSISALNIVKKDLAEFSSVMQEDTFKAASKVKEKLTQENANAATDKLKQGVSNLFGGISKALVIEPDDSYEPAQIVGGEAIVFDRFKARLHAIQIDPSTYTIEPSDEKYQEWLAATNLDNMKGDISDLLVSNVEVRALYTHLVPCPVSNTDFWRRYYFKRHLLEEEEARRLDLMRRADDAKEQKELGWDEDEDDCTDAKTHSTGAECSGSRLESAETSSVAKVNKALEQGFTTVSLSSDVVNDKPLELANDLNIAPITEANSAEIEPVTTDKTYQANSGETDVKHDASTTSDVKISSRNSSEDLAVASNSSMETVTVVTTGEVQSLQSTHSSEPSLSGWSALSDIKSSDDDSTKAMPLEKLVVSELAHGRKTPSDDSSNTKESLDDEWEKDFDVEVTEEDIRAAQNSLKTADPKKSEGTDNGAEDWEDW